MYLLIDDPLSVSGRQVVLVRAEDITERKQAEEALKHLNAVLRAIRNINQLIARETDRNRLIKGACDNLIETRGYFNTWICLLDESGNFITSAEAGLGKNFKPMLERLKSGELTACGRRALSQSDVVVTDDPPSACVDCPLAKTYYGRGAMSVRLEHGGNVYGLLATSIPTAYITDDAEWGLLKEVAGDIARALHTMETEEERKRAEDALRESEERYRRLVETMNEGLDVLDENGLFIYVNDKFCKMLGYSRDELIGRPVLDFVDKSNQNIAKEQLARQRKGERVSYELARIRKDGQKIFTIVSAAPILDADGHFKGSFAVVTDITELKWAKGERAKAAVIEAMGDGLILLNMDGKITSVNPAFEKMTGYEKSELVEKDIADVTSKLVKSGDLKKTMGTLGTALEGKVPASVTVTFVSRDGREIPVTFTISFMKDAKGKPTTIIVNIKDITELKRLEEERAKADKKRIEELEKFTKIAVDRELKMVELKKRIKELETRLKKLRFENKVN